MTVTEKLASLSITLPPVVGPYGAYIPAKRVGDLVYVSGQLPMKEGKCQATGKVPSQCSLEQARQAAKQCIINALAAVQSLPGGVDILTGVVRVGAFINSDDNFTSQPEVANAASEFLIEVFGDPGRHARSAIGVNTLPRDTAVEFEVIFSAGT